MFVCSDFFSGIAMISEFASKLIGFVFSLSYRLLLEGVRPTETGFLAL